MSALYKLIDRFSEGLGRAVSWLALIMVVLQFVLVVMRYLFGLSAVMLDESLIYMHGCLFLFAAGYTLKHNGHVRVDLNYRDAPVRTKAMVNLLGTLCFLLPMSIFILWAGLPFVDASWQSMEMSRSLPRSEQRFSRAATCVCQADWMKKKKWFGTASRVSPKKW